MLRVLFAQEEEVTTKTEGMKRIPFAKSTQNDRMIIKSRHNSDNK